MFKFFNRRSGDSKEGLIQEGGKEIPMAEVTITKQNFQAEVIESKVPVLLDFWAVWCGPCQMLAPGLAKVAEEYEGKAKVGKVNVDEQMELAQQFRIMNIPTLVVVKDGKIAKEVVGYQTQAQLADLLDQFVD